MPNSPSAADVRRALDRVYAGSNYDLQLRTDPREGVAEFFRPLREQFWDPIVRWWNGLEGRFPWVDEMLAGMLLVLAAAVIVQAFRLRARSRRPSLPVPAGDAVSRPEELQRQAETAAEQGEYVAAARCFLLASKLRLEQAEHRINRPGTTNRELLRRYRTTDLAAPLSTLVETVERGWFGGRPCTRVDYVSCRDAHEEIARRFAGSAHHGEPAGPRPRSIG